MKKLNKRRKNIKKVEWDWDATGLSVEFCSCNTGTCFIHGKGLNVKR